VREVFVLGPSRDIAPTPILAEVYQASQWNEFFIAVGGGAAALTGLVFVALSLNFEVVPQDATHRFGAIGTLTGFVSAFVICSLALMGHQDHVAIGVEWLTVAPAAAVYLYGYVRPSGSARATSGWECIVS
jgi:hypothetical protein